MATTQSNTGNSTRTSTKASAKSAKRPSRLDDEEVAASADAEEEDVTGTSIEQLTSAKGMIADRLNDVAIQIERFAPAKGAIGKTGSALVTSLTDVSAYLEANDVKDIVTDGASFAKKHSIPIALGLAGIGVGLLMSVKGVSGLAAAASSVTGVGKATKSTKTKKGRTTAAKARRTAH